MRPSASRAVVLAIATSIACQDVHALVAWQRALAGAGAYCAATIVTSPVDVLKVRIQADEKLSRQPTWKVAASMARREGLQVFFAGLGPALLMAPAAIVQFTLIDPLRAIMPLTLAALIAGTLDITIKCPLDRVKTKFQGANAGSARFAPPPCRLGQRA